MNKVARLILGHYGDAACFVVTINNVILNCLCRDMEMGTLYVKNLHKTKTMK